MAGFEEIKIAGNRVFLPPPADYPTMPFVGRKDLIEKALAAWSTLDGTPPLHFRLYGPPGTGKNALVYELARILKKDLYIIDGADDTEVEDLACLPAIDIKNARTLRLIGSPLFASLYRGNSILFFNEIAKAPQGALAALNSVLDERKTLSSKYGAITIKAAPGFLFCAALLEDEETGVGLPEDLTNRISKKIYVGNPSVAELGMIIKSHLQGNSDIWLEGFISLFKKNPLSVRSATNLIRDAIKLYKHSELKTASHEPSKRTALKYLRKVAEDYPVEIAKTELAPGLNAVIEKKRDHDVYSSVSKDKKYSIH